MMFQEWGTVDGDINADAIISDRRQGRKDSKIQPIANFLLVAGLAIWFGITGSHAALALEVIAAGWLTTSGIQRNLFEQHTMLMIAERRTQLIEQKIEVIMLDSERQ